MAKDMTKGKPLPMVIQFALPMMAGAAFQQLYSVVDMIVVGNAIGSRALAAIGATASITFMATSLVMGLTNGASVIASRFFGADEKDNLRKAFGASLYISLMAAILLAAVGWFGVGFLLRLLNTPEEIIADAELYAKICIGGGFGMMLYNCVTSLLRAVGDSRTPLIFLVISSVLNILLDVVFVLVLRLGIGAVAIATVIAQCFSAAACMIHMMKRYGFFRLTKADFRVPVKTIGMILAIGLPMCLQSLLLSIGDMTIASVVNSAGTDVVAAFATGSRIMYFVMMFCMQLAMAFSVFAGQNIGAKDIERIRRGFRDTVCVMLGMSLVMGVVILLSGDFLIRTFISSQDAHLEAIIPLAKSMLRVYAPSFVLLGAIWLYNYTLRGMGDVLVPFLSSMVELVMKVSLSIVLFRAFGHIGIWFANPIGWALGLIPSVVRFHTGGWRKLAKQTAQWQ